MKKVIVSVQKKFLILFWKKIKFKNEKSYYICSRKISHIFPKKTTFKNEKSYYICSEKIFHTFLKKSKIHLSGEASF